MGEVIALTSGSVTLNAAGSGDVYLQPDRAHTWWRVTRLVCSTSPTTDADLLVFRNSIGSATLLDTTGSAFGDVSETDYTIRSGERLIAAFRNGTPGAIGTLVIYGELMGVLP